MSDDLDRLPPEDESDLMAAEYVLGVLAPADARALEAVARTDAALSSSIGAWEMRLAPLVDLIEPREPPAVLWRRLALATGIDSVIQAPVPPRRSAWRGPGLWRATTAGALAIAASLGFLLVARPAVQPQPLVAALSPYGGPGATFLVRVGSDGAATVVAVGDTNVPAGRSLELWAVAGQAAPVSLGLLPESGRARLRLPGQGDASQGGPGQEGVQLLVSQEPAGGSPTKAPTGPVVYAGKLTGL